MRTRLLLSAAIAFVVLAAGSVLVRRHSRLAAARVEVHRWTRTIDWWDHEGTEAENRQRQAAVLRAMGDAAVEPLIDDLNFDPVYLRLLKRFQILASLRSPTDPNDEPTGCRRNAAYYLGVLGPLASPGLRTLIAHTTDSDPMVRFLSAIALGKVGRDDPAVRSVLTNLLAVSDRYIPFGAAMALWRLDPKDTEARRRVESLIPTLNLAEAAELLVAQGAEADVFAPTLARHAETLPLSEARIRVDAALWKLTGDRNYVLRDLGSIGPALRTGIATNRAAKWSEAETALITAAYKLDDEREFRDLMLPMLRMVQLNSMARSQNAAVVYFKRVEALNQRSALKELKR